MMQAVLPDAIAFALLGAIESLLSAVVADGMTGRRHRSNCELVAQGFANIGSSLFGGICVTGTIARTATNVRAGAHGPVSGMLHALFLLVFMLAGRAARRLHPARRAGRRAAVVAWNMVEKTRHAILSAPPGATRWSLVTFALVVFRDLTEGIVVGFALGSVLFIDRMAKADRRRGATGVAIADVADTETAPPALRSGRGQRSRHRRLPHHRRLLLRRRLRGRAPCSTASPTSAATSSSTARPCPSSIPPPPTSSRAPPARRAAPASGSSSPALAAGPPHAFKHGVRPPLVRYKATTRTALEQLHNDRRSDEKAD